MLRKELFCFQDNKIAVQFWYEYRDASDGMKWKRCYGLEDWTYGEDGKMVCCSLPNKSGGEGVGVCAAGCDVESAEADLRLTWAFVCVGEENDEWE